MSKKTANQFLEAAAVDATFREQFKSATNVDEFIKIAQDLGYSFSPEDLNAIVQEFSGETTLRRKTGIWPWLRLVNWNVW
jgi:predicted ribosomally synthesized peptide with nif11-like leader